MRITFLRDEIFECDGRLSGPEFPEGCVVDCTQEFGERWIHRGAAEMVDENRLPKSGERWEIVSFGERRARPATQAQTRKPAPVSKPKAIPAKSAKSAKAPKPAADDAADTGADSQASTSGADTVASGSGQDTVTSCSGFDTVDGGGAQDQLNL